MATATMLPMSPRSAKLSFADLKCVRSRAAVVVLAACFHKSAGISSQKFYSRFCFIDVTEPLLVNNLKKMTWSIGSRVDGGGIDPSSADSPMKLFFLLVGFYCATAFATVIGQTGDWDILSAGLAVVVVEGIGALMYRGSFPLVSKVRSVITMFNYWKAGLSLGLFLDSFKYEIDNIIESSNPFNFDIDISSIFL